MMVGGDRRQRRRLTTRPAAAVTMAPAAIAMRVRAAPAHTVVANGVPGDTPNKPLELSICMLVPTEPANVGAWRPCQAAPIGTPQSHASSLNRTAETHTHAATTTPSASTTLRDRRTVIRLVHHSTGGRAPLDLFSAHLFDLGTERQLRTAQMLCPPFGERRT
jgi:hypothetical protein